MRTHSLERQGREGRIKASGNSCSEDSIMMLQWPFLTVGGLAFRAEEAHGSKMPIIDVSLWSL